MKEGINALRELMERDEDDSSMKRRLEYVAESVSDAIHSTASGAVAVRASALVPLLEQVIFARDACPPFKALKIHLRRITIAYRPKIF